MAKEDATPIDGHASTILADEVFDLPVLATKLAQAHAVITVLAHRFGGALDASVRENESVHVWMATQTALDLVHSAAANALEAPCDIFCTDVASLLYQAEGLLHLLESEGASQHDKPCFPDAVMLGYFQSVMDLTGRALASVNAAQTPQAA